MQHHRQFDKKEDFHDLDEATQKTILAYKTALKFSDFMSKHNLHNR